MGFVCAPRAPAGARCSCVGVERVAPVFPLPYKNTMPKGTRLSRNDFKQFSRTSRRIAGRYFTLVVSFGATGSGPKAACVVTKKIAARAVDRNLIKRRARAALHKALCDVKDPLMLAFYAKKEARDAPFPSISEDVQNLIMRAIGK